MVSRKIIATTNRCYLHEATVDDATDAFELNSDPEVMRYTGDKGFASVEEAGHFLSQYPDYKKNGMGRWWLRLKESDEFIGWCGLKRHQNDEVDLGFRILKKHWRNGYATEAAECCLNIGFSEFELAYIIGRVVPENQASVAVLKKIGMVYWKEITCEEHDAHCYRITKSNWENAH